MKPQQPLRAPELAIGFVAACAIEYFLMPHPTRPTPEVYAAWVQLGLLVLSIALSYLAGKLLAKKVKPTFDDRVTTLATRGSYLPRLIGRRKMGPIFAWAGNRFTRKEKMPGGKGSLFAGPKGTAYFESAWHCLAMGPVHKLHNITQNGDVLFKGPITSTSHPSGSTIDLGSEGSFRIFWGEFDQPINTYLGDADRVTISSRWPGCCYVEWREKRLGTSAIWPTLEYELECRTQSTILVNTPAYMEPTRVLDGAEADIIAAVAGVPGIGYFEFGGNISGQFFPGQQISLTNHTGMGDQNFIIGSIELRYEYTVVGVFPITGDPIIHTDTFTDIYPEDVTVAGTSGTGEIEGYTDAEDDGINYAHVIAELLFLGNGYGLAHDLDLYDMDSLEDLGTLCVTENLRASIVAQNGTTYQEVLSGILIDLGVFLSTDYTTGLLKFVPLREPTGILANVSTSLQTALPEIAVQHADRPVTNVLYSFVDRDHKYEATTIGADDDGQVFETNVAKAETNQIISTINFVTASVITNRRQQEALAGGASVVLKTNRGTRELVPGIPLMAEGFDEVLRLLTVDSDPLSGQVALQVVTDYYGAPLSTFLQNYGLPPVSSEPTSPDIQTAIVEVPEYLLQGTQEQTLLIPRVRYNDGVQGADLHLSRDDVTFSAVGRDLSLMAGGTLLDPMTALDFQRPANSFQFTARGPDIDDVLDLSADLPSWCNGRQLCVLVDPDTLSYEICFVKKVTAVGGGIYTLDGIIRARYDTPQQDFGVDAQVYILQNDDGFLVSDVLLEPEVTVYVKTQPFGTGGQLPLSEAVSAQMALYGKGIRPITPANIRIDVGLTTWTAGADFVVSWDYFTPRTTGSGAGFQGAGSAASDTAPEGDFLVEILNASDTVIRQFNQPTAGYTYTFAQRNTDFTGDPASLKFRITQLRGGFSSDTNTQTFTKVS